jgi:hypothetical protein
VALLVWALLTRRVRLAIISVAVTVIADLVGWAVIGFAGLSGYPALLGSLARSAASHGPLLVSTLVNLGLGLGIALSLAGTVAALLLTSAMRIRDDRWIFTAALSTAVLVTPVMWLHYMAILLVAVAVWRPRLDELWIAPLGLWILARTYDSDFTRPVWTSLVILASLAFLLWRIAVMRPAAPSLPRRRAAVPETPVPDLGRSATGPGLGLQ